MPRSALEVTIVRYNSFVDLGVDEDFGKPTPAHKIIEPLYHAAWATPTPHGSRSGLRINAKCQVIDHAGQVIPGLYCGGESAGGLSQHSRAGAGSHRWPECAGWLMNSTSCYYSADFTASVRPADETRAVRADQQDVVCIATTKATSSLPAIAMIAASQQSAPMLDASVLIYATACGQIHTGGPSAWKNARSDRCVPSLVYGVAGRSAPRG